jgi:hypothetical protein
MFRRRSSLAFFAAATTAAMAIAIPRVAAQRETTVLSVLDAAAAYLDAYDQRFSAVVSEEHYEQMARGTRATITGHRVLRSDLLLLNAGEAGWLCFRDVYEVDGRPVRDRSTRLMDLFVHPQPDAIDQASKIREEGARFNIGGLNRTVNDPTMVLPFLRRAQQRRSVFELGGGETVAGTRTRVLSFKELAMPRMIHTSDDSPASGRVWVEPETGRVVRTELVLATVDGRAKIVVTYAPQAKLDGLWAPARMEEHYEVGASRTIDGVATYTNFRQFSVNVGAPLALPADPAR